jgi:hypothetical protein
MKKNTASRFQIRVCGLQVSQKKISLQNLMFPFKLADGLWKAKNNKV